MFIYETPPQDIFSGMKKFSDEVRHGKEASLITDLLKGYMYCAYYLLKAKGCSWEGDIRDDDIYFFSIPDPDNARELFGYVWKQDNNGTTFICSPIQIKWLDAYRLGKQT